METEAGISTDTQGQNARTLTAAEERTYRWIRNAAVLGVMFGLLSITASFAVAYLGFQTLSRCDDRAEKDCTLSAAQYKLAREYRVSAATLFPFGSLVVIVGLYMNRKAMVELNRRKSEILISTVTQCGLLKTPTPALIQRSDVHSAAPRLVDAELQDDLPKYEVTVSVYSGTSATDTNTADNRENNEIADDPNIDEDVINPPPSYEEALELEVLQQTRQEQHAAENVRDNNMRTEVLLADEEGRAGGVDC